MMSWYKNEIAKQNHIFHFAKWNWLQFFHGFSYPVIASILYLAAQLGLNEQELQNILQKNNYNPEAVIQTLKQKTENSQQESLIEQPPIQNVEQKTTNEKPNYFVARVIFSEAAGTSPEERELVAGVIMNRMQHPGFGRGKLDSMEAVTKEKNAFEAINDPNNKNWQKTENPTSLSHEEKQIWDHALSLSSGNVPQNKLIGPSGRPLVYYHDKSISMPLSWNNKYWRAIKEVETEHFIFYSVLPKK